MGFPDDNAQDRPAADVGSPEEQDDDTSAPPSLTPPSDQPGLPTDPDNPATG